VLITPFHNMMLVPPMATDADIYRLVRVWSDCMGEIAEKRRARCGREVAA